METQKIPQKDIKEVLNHFFSNENKIINSKTKISIKKILFSQKDRIIIAITKSGRDIIWNRDKLIRTYGWFFFVSESEDRFKEKKPNKTKRKPKKEERTTKTEEYKFNDNIIVLKQKENMRPLYKTKEYFKYFKTIAKADEITTKYK